MQPVHTARPATIDHRPFHSSIRRSFFTVLFLNVQLADVDSTTVQDRIYTPKTIPLFGSNPRAQPNNGRAGTLSRRFGRTWTAHNGCDECLEDEADIANLQAWLGHANINTIRIHDHRQKGLRILLHTK